MPQVGVSSLYKYYLGACQCVIARGKCERLKKLTEGIAEEAFEMQVGFLSATQTP
jgi:hypothetical protein